MLKRIINQQAKGLPKAALILSIASFLSITLGVLRDRLLAGRFGASSELDIYYAAFALPDLINMILISGAISAAIIPLFSVYWQKDENQAKKFVAGLCRFFFVALLALSSLLFIFTEPLVNLLAPGFSGQAQAQVVLLTRLMLLSPFLLGLSNIISGILQVFARFFITALAPIFYNLGIIFGILFLAPRFGLIGLALGVILGGCLHLFIQLPVFFSLGFPLSIFFKKQPLWQDSIKKVFKLTLPRSFGLAANQINFIVMLAIASTLAIGSVTIFNLANTLRRGLLLVLAAPFSTAAFPMLSLSFAKAKSQDFLNNFLLSFRLLFFLIIPSSVLLFFLRNELIVLIFRTGKFSQDDVKLTATCLALFALSLFAYSLILLLSKAFYAMQNSKLPAVASILGVVLNVVLGLSLVNLLQKSHYLQMFLAKLFALPQTANFALLGLPLAFSIAGILQFFFLFSLFSKKNSRQFTGLLKTTCFKTILASFLMLFTLYLTERIIYLANWSRLIVFGLLAGLIFVIFSWLLRSDELFLFKDFLKRKLFSKKRPKH